MDKKKILKEPFGIVKTATIRTFLQCADYLLKNGNKALRLKDLEASGVSHFMAAEFVTFGLDFGFLETEEGSRRRQLTYKLSNTGLVLYRPLLELEKKLRKSG